jgi:hypothetical protein
MNVMKTITAAVVLSASIVAPALAQDAYQSFGGAPYRYAPQYYRSYDVPPGSYAPQNDQELWNQRNFGFSGRDPSRVGGGSPNLNPSS